MTDLLRIAGRRWYFLILALLVATALSWVGFSAATPTYQSEASVLFVPSPESAGTDGKPGNPYLDLGAALTATASVVSVAVTDDKVARDLFSQGATARYSVALDLSVEAPVLHVVTSDSDAASSTATMQKLLHEINVVLTQLQADAGAPTVTLIQTTVISQTAEPRKLLKGPIRDGIAGGVGGFLIALIPVLFLERQSRRRSRTISSSVDRTASEKPQADVVVDADAGDTASPVVSQR